MGRPARDLNGRKFGRWTVVERDSESQGGCGRHAKWVCQCECGAVHSVNSSMLVAGKSKSCGCLQSELVSQRNTKHGMYGTKIYEAWNGMMDRCYNPNMKFFKHYGGRGIKVCDEWRDFANFAKDMGNPPTPDHTLDRISTNGDYTPGNCRWATSLTQQNNRRNNIRITHKDVEKSVSEWSRELHIPAWKIRARLRAGWSVDRCLSK